MLQGGVDLLNTLQLPELPGTVMDSLSVSCPCGSTSVLHGCCKRPPSPTPVYVSPAEGLLPNPISLLPSAGVFPAGG